MRSNISASMKIDYLPLLPVFEKAFKSGIFDHIN